MSRTEPVLPAEAIDAGWLTQVLAASGHLEGGAVIGVDRAPCGTGQLGDSYRFTLTYDPPASGPASLVGKFASADPTSREFGRSSGYYRTEIGFYERLAPRLPVSIPTAVHAALADNDTDFVLLMEDLAPARQVDQLAGCSADESARVLEQAATLHAASWRSGNLQQQNWLRGPVSMFHQVTDNFAGVVRQFPELCGDLVPDADLAEAARLIGHEDNWKAILGDPQCLWHSDLRADNVLFDAQGGSRPVVVLDWQGLGYGRGTVDLAYWLGTSMPVDERRAHERALVAHYHDALAGHGVTGYDAESCWNDYRLHAIHGLQVGVFGLGAVKRSERGDRMWQNWIERCAAQVRDLDSFAVLAAR